MRALFPQATLFSMYGLTECKRVTYLPPEQLEIRPTSVGRGMPNEEVWLVDEQGKRLPNGSTGELVIRGSNVMRVLGARADGRTLEAEGPIRASGCSIRRHLRTDEKGYLYFVARKDDIVKSRGEKVSPKEVENVLYGLEGVQDAAVIGVPDHCSGPRSRRSSYCDRATPTASAMSSSTVWKSSRASWSRSTSCSPTGCRQPRQGRSTRTS